MLHWGYFPFLGKVLEVTIFVLSIKHSSTYDPESGAKQSNLLLNAGSC
jgi:hypothetical protein